jgi:hypothetical protein
VCQVEWQIHNCNGKGNNLGRRANQQCQELNTIAWSTTKKKGSIENTYIESEWLEKAAPRSYNPFH